MPCAHHSLPDRIFSFRGENIKLDVQRFSAPRVVRRFLVLFQAPTDYTSINLCQDYCQIQVARRAEVGPCAKCTPISRLRRPRRATTICRSPCSMRGWGRASASSSNSFFVGVPDTAFGYGVFSLLVLLKQAPASRCCCSTVMGILFQLFDNRRWYSPPAA